jgi:hypothetical protein
VAGLRAAATRHGTVGDGAAALAVGVARLMVEARALGDVAAAGEFIRVASSVREAQANSAAGEAERRRQVVARLQATAALGERLTDNTTDIARGVAPFGDGTGILAPPPGSAA